MFGDRIQVPTSFAFAQKYLEMRRIHDFPDNIATAVLFRLLELSAEKVNSAVIPNPAVQALRSVSELEEDDVRKLREAILPRAGKVYEVMMQWLKSIGESVSKKYSLQAAIPSTFEQFCIAANIKLNFVGEIFNPKCKLEVYIGKQNKVYFLLYKSLAWENTMALPCGHIGLKFQYNREFAIRSRRVACSETQLQTVAINCGTCATPVTDMAIAAAAGRLQYQEGQSAENRCYKCHRDMSNLQPSAICSQHLICKGCAMRNILSADFFFTPCCLKYAHPSEVLSLMSALEGMPAVNQTIERKIGHFDLLIFCKELSSEDLIWQFLQMTGACDICWYFKGNAVESCTCLRSSVQRRGAPVARPPLQPPSPKFPGKVRPVYKPSNPTISGQINETISTTVSALGRSCEHCGKMRRIEEYKIYLLFTHACFVCDICYTERKMMQEIDTCLNCRYSWDSAEKQSIAQMTQRDSPFSTVSCMHCRRTAMPLNYSFSARLSHWWKCRVCYSCIQSNPPFLESCGCCANPLTERDKVILRDLFSPGSKQQSGLIMCVICSKPQDQGKYSEVAKTNHRCKVCNLCVLNENRGQQRRKCPACKVKLN